MNLYLVSQTVNNDWDTFDAIVVCAANENHARKIPPGELRDYMDDEDGDYYGRWARHEELNVKLIGKALDCMLAGLILASFKAG